jgi:tetratricopeptide (TPR) repeat protein
MAKIYSNKANVLDELGRYRTALSCYDRAVEIRDRLVNQQGLVELRGDLAKALVYRADILEKLGDVVQARSDARGAIPVLRAEFARTRRHDLGDVIPMAVEIAREGS